MTQVKIGFSFRSLNSDTIMYQIIAALEENPLKKKVLQGYLNPQNLIKEICNKD